MRRRKEDRGKGVREGGRIRGKREVRGRRKERGERGKEEGGMVRGGRTREGRVGEEERKERGKIWI